jgi:alkylation response protein AidB-like acyl-CoA dehydrogenase
MNERFAAGASRSPAAVFPLLASLATRPNREGGCAAGDPRVRQALAHVYTMSRLFDLTNARVRARLAQGSIPGPEGSILKLSMSDVWTAQADLALRLMGAAGTVAGADAPEGGRWQDAFLGAPATHIGGGTDEIQRNLIAEQVLGLPREPVQPDGQGPGVAPCSTTGSSTREG